MTQADKIASDMRNAIRIMKNTLVLSESYLSKIIQSQKEVHNLHNKLNPTPLPLSNRILHPRSFLGYLSDTETQNLLLSYSTTSNLPGKVSDQKIQVVPINANRISHSNQRKPNSNNLKEIRRNPEGPNSSSDLENPEKKIACLLINCRSAIKHAADIADLIMNQEADITILTEIWLSEASSPCLDLLVPPNYNIIRLDSQLKAGGGVACIHRSNITISKVVSDPIDSCEYLGLSARFTDNQVYKIHAFYHPPGKNLSFIDHLMEIITINSDPHANNIFLGDFNLHWNDLQDNQVNNLKEFLDEHSLRQACTLPTHSKGATLDWIIAKENTIQAISIIPCDWSDHHVITFQIPDSNLATYQTQTLGERHQRPELGDSYTTSRK